MNYTKHTLFVKTCRKCGAELLPESRFCHLCGAPQERIQAKNKRGNGQGSVYRRGDSWVAVVTLGYIREGTARPKRITRSKTFAKKSDAIAALPTLKAGGVIRPKTTITFKALYDQWLPTHRAGKDTMNCYKAAFQYFKPVWFLRMDELTLDDLQECVDECPRARQTRRNMRTVCGLIYKYGIPRDMIPSDRNLADYLMIDGEGATHRESFTDVQIERIRKQIGKTLYADYVYCLIYTGFRPSEFLALTKESYHEKEQYFIGGGKTEAGTDRVVTIPPKIQKHVKAAAKRAGKTIFCREDGEPFTKNDFLDVFYAVLTAAGIDNPIITVGNGVQRHKFTPHSCRHTYSTLMKRVDAPSTDKLALIGHTSESMLRYYQDVHLADLRKITDAL